MSRAADAPPREAGAERGRGCQAVVRSAVGDEQLELDNVLPSTGKDIAMARVIEKRVTAEIKGDFVVFLIGMRINKLRRVGR